MPIDELEECQELDEKIEREIMEQEALEDAPEQPKFKSKID